MNPIDALILELVAIPVIAWIVGWACEEFAAKWWGK